MVQLLFFYTALEKKIQWKKTQDKADTMQSKYFYTEPYPSPHDQRH